MSAARRAGLALYLPCLVLLLFSRYAAAPVTDFLGDDWPILDRSRTFESFAASAATARGEPDRPLGASLLFSVFRAIGDRPALFTLHNIVHHAVILLLFLLCVNQLTGNRRATAIAGVVFALLPHPADLYNWATVAIYLPAFIAYVGAAAAWIRYARGGAFGWAPLSGILMLLGSATFEAGFALPLAFLALVRRDRPARDLGALAFPCAGAGLYLAWRFTRGFGAAPGVLYESRAPSVDLSYLAWNAKEFFSGWMGENLLTTITQGLSGFATLPKWEWRGLFVAALGAALLVGWTLARKPPATPIPRGAKHTALRFAGLWFLATALPCIVSWQAGRLHFLPGMAVAMAAGVLLADRDPRAWVPAFSLATALLLLANLGSAQLWQDCGRFHRRLYRAIQDTRPLWHDAEVVLFTSDSLRRRLTPGILAPDAVAAHAWSKYGSADLIRGTAPGIMVRMASGNPRAPFGILDMESGARWEGDTLHWHDRWNPARPHATPRNKVHTVDILEAVTRGAHD